MSPLLAPPSSEPEPPFRPREKIVEKQRYFQSVHRPTYLKGRYDAITSVAIPLALAVSSMYLVVRAPPIPRASQRPRFSNTCADRRIVLIVCCVRAGARDLQHVPRHREGVSPRPWRSRPSSSSRWTLVLLADEPDLLQIRCEKSSVICVRSRV